MNRRDFLIKSALLSSSSLFPVSTFSQNLSASSFNINSISPISTLSSFSAAVTGDTHDEAHEIFWNKPGFIQRKGGLPRPDEHFDVVIVGGGLAGLSSAYHLKGEKVLMLEGHPRLGGNAKTEKYKKTMMSLGSAYVTIPEKGGFLESFYKDIGVQPLFKKVPKTYHPVLYKGNVIESFWHGASDPQKKDEFIRVYEKLVGVYENSYPELPLIPGMDIDRSALNQLDLLSLDQWVTQELGEIHPHIKEYFHQYCWSSFSTGYEQISAAQFLNFFTSDLAGTQALPGGNGLIAHAILNKVKNNDFHVKTKSFVADIREDKKGVYVCYHDQSRTLKSITADKCIVASPKLVAKHIIEGLSETQHKAMDDMIYHAYLVANILFKKPIEAKHYDLYSLINEVPRDEYKDSKKRVFSDITFANWASDNQQTPSAITLYLPLPYAMAQQFLFSNELYSKYSKRIQKALDPFLKGINRTWDDVEDLRLTRYGHSVAVAEKGAIASGILERAHSPINNKIFFANQDNWANPCLETSYAVGTVAAFQATNRDLPL